MRLVFFAYILLTKSLLFASDPERKMPLIRVYKDDLAKVYTLFFADTVKRDIIVKLKDMRGAILFEEEIHGNGFSKPYGLKDLRNGNYQFTIIYDGKQYNEEIELKSEKQILAESITLDKDYPSLTVNVTEHNLNPMNILVYTLDDELLKIYYWEPNEKIRSKKIDMSVFNEYEVRVQILQEGENKLEQLVKLY